MSTTTVTKCDPSSCLSGSYVSSQVTQRICGMDRWCEWPEHKQACLGLLIVFVGENLIDFLSLSSFKYLPLTFNSVEVSKTFGVVDKPEACLWVSGIRLSIRS